MSWDSEIKRIIQGKWAIGKGFTINEIYEYEEHFKMLYPNNKYIHQKIQETLQHLRDDGTIEFLDNMGSYKRIR